MFQSLCQDEKARTPEDTARGKVPDRSWINWKIPRRKISSTSLSILDAFISIEPRDC
jgi:hypothetical protein